MSLYSFEIEKSIIATLLTIDDSFEHTGGDLQVSDFYAERHQKIFGIIQSLADSGLPYDVVMVQDRIVSEGLEAVTGGEAYLSELLINTVASLFNMQHYISRIKDLARRRRIHEELRKAQAAIENSEFNPEDVWSNAADGVNDALNGAKGDTFQSVGDMLESFVENLNFAAVNGVTPAIKTGIIELDNKVMISKGDMCVVAARPSMGKTTLALNMLENMAANYEGMAVMFSLEMNKEAVMKRLMSNVASVEMSKIFTGQGLTEDDWQNIMVRAEYVQNLPLIIDDRSGLTAGQMRATLNRIRQKHGKITAIMVDYLQLMKGTKKSYAKPSDEIQEISAALKALAKEFDCPMIALSQLNRGLESRPNKRPIMSDIRESGAIEQDADQIIFIYRDVVYNENTEDPNVAELIVGKQRNSSTGTVRVMFDGKHNRFTDLVQQNEVYEEVF